jgi:putative endonuclease
MPNNTEKGNLGEKIACDYLSNLGYKIKHSNWRHQHLEIDIIAEYQNMLIIVEVKLRATDAFGEPKDFVGKGKQKKLIKAADFYIKEYNIDTETRFDIISILENNGQFHIEHIENAFHPVP